MKCARLNLFTPWNKMQLSRRRLAQKLRFPGDYSQDLCVVMLGHGQANGRTDRHSVHTTLVINAWVVKLKPSVYCFNLFHWSSHLGNNSPLISLPCSPVIHVCWEPGHTSVWTHQCLHTSVTAHTIVRTNQCLNPPVSGHTSVHTHQCRHTSVWIHKLLHTPVSAHTSVWTH